MQRYPDRCYVSDRHLGSATGRKLPITQLFGPVLRMRNRSILCQASLTYLVGRRIESLLSGILCRTDPEA
ncbi:hypothetical protein Mal48_07720 [Thalassoglobus polymorphus]|uniref:Uncharacterized protein n=1 Tax=Thalassoglobus polymorphus TaxID=2527994 RepID=A0A517QIV4_9PLAN|nr:hypothetical protein Mal48_07720 [Thalassoglobus polymorphus]